MRISLPIWNYLGLGYLSKYMFGSFQASTRVENRLIETVLLSTHKIYFASEIRKIIFKNALLSGVLDPDEMPYKWYFH